MKWPRIYLLTTAAWLMGSVTPTRGQYTKPDGSCDMATAAEVQLIRHDLESLKTLLGDLSIQLRKLEGTPERIDSISQQLEQISDDVYVPSFYKKGYKVHHFQSPLGRYMYDLAGAKARCQEEGMTIATPQQLQVAWEEGMNVCACGWLSDGTNRYPIQYPHQGCGGTTSGVITCSYTLVDVYCYNK